MCCPLCSFFTKDLVFFKKEQICWSLFSHFTVAFLFATFCWSLTTKAPAERHQSNAFNSWFSGLGESFTELVAAAAGNWPDFTRFHNPKSLFLRLLMLLARLLGCFACQCSGEDELITGLVFRTGDFQGNTSVIVIAHSRLFLFARGGWNTEGWLLLPHDT